MRLNNNQFCVCTILHHLAMQLCQGYNCIIGHFEMSAELFVQLLSVETFIATITKGFAITQLETVERCLVTRGCDHGLDCFFNRVFVVVVDFESGGASRINRCAGTIQNCGTQSVQIGPRLGCEVRPCYFCDPTGFFRIMLASVRQNGEFHSDEDFQRYPQEHLRATEGYDESIEC